MAHSDPGLHGGRGPLRPDYGDCQPVAHRLRRRQSGHDLSARRRCGRALYGRWPSVLATVINVISFDLFFIAPRGTLAVSDVQYILTFAVMLTVGLVIGNLTAGVRYQHALPAIASSARAICMKCQNRWRLAARSEISCRPASSLSVRPFMPVT
ncbi:DUF4118 domain-containing protein [Enterobacter hormaechei]|uniref:DUF4118 domain-containing protein n=1 Tax=Enterobacter hormaechei TaxID=158836 RepID=A0A4Y5ZR52_9ENTR|nr:DUF4118 domain-containing protein [Enterobacter hormaechei]